MDRRKFVFGTIAGSSAFLGLAGLLAPSLISRPNHPKSRLLDQSEFENMVADATKKKQHLFLPPNSKIRLTRPTQINISINGQGSHFHFEQKGQLLIGKNQYQDIHLRNFKTSSKRVGTNSLIIIAHTQDVLLENIEIISKAQTPITISNSQNVQIIKSKVLFSGQSGAQIQHSRDISFQNNVFLAKKSQWPEQDFLSLDRTLEVHITHNVFKSDGHLASLNFIGRPADKNSFISNNKFLAS